MNRLDNVVTVGVIVSEYMRQLDIRLKTQGHRTNFGSVVAVRRWPLRRKSRGHRGDFESKNPIKYNAKSTYKIPKSNRKRCCKTQQKKNTAWYNTERKKNTAYTRPK